MSKRNLLRHGLFVGRGEDSKDGEEASQTRRANQEAPNKAKASEKQPLNKFRVRSETQRERRQTKQRWQGWTKSLVVITKFSLLLMVLRSTMFTFDLTSTILDGHGRAILS